MTSEATIFLVDDDQAVRDAVSLFLESKGFAVEVYSNARAFLKAYKPERPGCLVLDIRMPGISGLELQEMLAARRIHIPIIFVTGHGDIPMAAQAIKAGANDFLEKPFDNAYLLECVKKGLETDAERRAVHTEASNIRGRYDRLTRRERDVLDLVINGYSNKDIAVQLNISHRTVEVHRHRLMDKMKAASLCELINMCIMCGIYQPQLKDKK